MRPSSRLQAMEYVLCGESASCLPLLGAAVPLSRCHAANVEDRDGGSFVQGDTSIPGHHTRFGETLFYDPIHVGRR